MKFKFGKPLKIIAAIALILILAIASTTVYTITASWPQESGQISLPQLHDRVEVRRDAYGIPQIYARNPHDLFLAQGYIHAQDRFWQMDFWRHLGSGRLSEMFGESQYKTDRFLRTMGWARIARQELELLPPEHRSILEDYTAGVNAYLSNHNGITLSLEYGALKAVNPNYKPEPWEPIHTLTWAKVMAWDLGTNMDKEIEQGVLRQTLSRERVEELFPPYPSTHAVILPDWKVADTTLENYLSKLPETFDTNISTALASLADSIAEVEAIAGSRGGGIGSNSWVISGQKTATGKPLLANDPHLGVQMPSIWYENGLHCLEKTAECPYDFTGFSFAGMVGVIIGHNDRIAWGVTNVSADTMDLFVEKINPNNPNQYEVNGKWVEMKGVTERIKIAGADDKVETIRYTRHGPIVSDSYDRLTQLVAPEGKQDSGEKYAIALQWTALEPATLFGAIVKLNKAQNWQDFRAAAEDFNIAQQNLIYADIEGNIGYQMPGKLPIRSKGEGRYPVPGWTNEYEWKGYVPFKQLPFRLNPPQGYIVTANNQVVGDEYPYLITKDWEYGFRAQRIVNAIEERTSPFAVKDLQQIQADNKSLNAEKIVPILLNLPLTGERLNRVRELLRDWDFQEEMNEPQAAIFEMFWERLLALTFHDDLPIEYWPDGDDRWMSVVANLIENPNSPWWEDNLTSEPEDRDRIFEKAFLEAVNQLEERLGTDPNQWLWGSLHRVTFRNQSLGKSGISAIEAIFNRGPFPTSGGNAIVNATAWNANNPFIVNALPSMRTIVDLNDFDAMLGINSTGQSGHAFHPHYNDMVELWRHMEYLPIPFDRHTVEVHAAKSLILQPGLGDRS